VVTVPLAEQLRIYIAIFGISLTRNRCSRSRAARQAAAARRGARVVLVLDNRALELLADLVRAPLSSGMQREKTHIRATLSIPLLVLLPESLSACLNLWWPLQVLVDVLLSGCVSHVTMHCKAQPVFVSDAMVADIEQTLAWIEARPTAAPIARRLRDHMQAGSL
jgi:hypothetical protein